MIFLIPLLIFIPSILMFLKYPDNFHKGFLPFILSLITGFFLLLSGMIFLAEYGQYISSRATVAYCNEAIDNKTLELNDTVSINKTNEIYENKFSKIATHTKNLDTPIASTQEYLNKIQQQRLDERNDCMEAKKDVLAFELGFYGFTVKGLK
jgi:hypothetical protein